MADEDNLGRPMRSKYVLLLPTSITVTLVSIGVRLDTVDLTLA
jgi:hypothetical protein